MSKLKLYIDDSIPGCEIMGFNHMGMFITDPTTTECGRFEVDPIKEYGLTQKQVDKILKHNKDLYGIYFGEFKSTIGFKTNKRESK
jgi:hypothetical protein